MLNKRHWKHIPIDIIPDDDTMEFTSSDRNEVIRLGYIKGYDQAMQDLIEKAPEDLDWKSFRNQAAKDILCAVLPRIEIIDGDFQQSIENAISINRCSR